MLLQFFSPHTHLCPKLISKPHFSSTAGIILVDYQNQQLQKETQTSMPKEVWLCNSDSWILKTKHCIIFSKPLKTFISTYGAYKLSQQ